MRSETSIWRSMSEELTFPADRIDVWRVELDSPEPPGRDLQSMLADDERNRAARFHFDRDRNRYIQGRAALRVLLGRYLDIPPREVRLQYQAHGKPELAPPGDSRSLRFNVSNSGGLALIAAGGGRELGIDVEKVRPLPDLLDVARRFFSAREVKALLATDANRRGEAFFACWTRKEAFLKVTGAGLSYPLSAFSVSVDPDGPGEMLELTEPRDVACEWSLCDVEVGRGFRGALAWEGGSQRLQFWEFQAASSPPHEAAKREHVLGIEV